VDTPLPLALPWPLEMLDGLTARQVADVLVRRGFVTPAPLLPRMGLEIVGTFVPEAEHASSSLS
jgi:hypothetical protein